MTEMLINLKTLEDSGLCIEEFVLLQAVVEEIELPEGIFVIPNAYEGLEEKMYIKILDDSIEVRQKTLDLFKIKLQTVRFEDFWEQYHKVTKLPRTDRAAAEKYWGRLKQKEKKLAFDNIVSYYNSLNDKRFCKKARTYLADKNFYDEFNSTDTKDDYFITKV